MATEFVIRESETRSFNYSLAVSEVVTVVRRSPSGVCTKSIAGARMVIVYLENLLDEVSPQVTPLSLDQVRPLRLDFIVPVQQSDGRSLQSRNGAHSYRY